MNPERHRPDGFSLLAVTAALFTVAVLMWPSHARAAEPPAFPHIAAAWATKLIADEELEAENRRLRAKLKKEHRANVHHARMVRKLRRANRRRIAYGPSGVASGFQCIHTFEGAWDDPNAPYYGGVQMDLSFQRTYGPNFLRKLGTADHWPPFIQVAVAMSAYYSGRGYYPWPNTARYCGLL